MSVRNHRDPRSAFEALEPRKMLTADPAGLLAEGFEPVNWQGQETFAKPGEWIIRLDGLKGTPANQLGAANSALAKARNEVRATQHLGDDGLVLIKVPRALTHQQLADSLSNVPGLRHMEPNTAIWSTAVPNDPHFTSGSLWGLHNTGQNGGRTDADVDGPEAWDSTTGDSKMVIGVIDSGVDYKHPDLAANIWKNPGEVAGDGVDNDRNGYIDDIHGYDFYNNDGDPMDDNEHGTHVAGTIAGVGNNGVGVTGVSWNSQIVGIKFLSASGSGSLSGAIAAVNYATRLNKSGVNIRITNNSWSGGAYSQELYNAIKASNDAGMLFIAAAGNGDRLGNAINNDASPQYPASYDLPNVIAVAATDRNDNKASWSNYGQTSVDLGAPGVDIVSTVPGGGYKSFSGTSMAAPHVAGAAALAWARDPSAGHTAVREAILKGADPVSSLSGITVTGGRLNVANTLQHITPTPPAAPSALTATAVSSSRIDLSWTDNSNNESGFYIQRWDGATFATVATVGPDQTSYSDTGLAASTTYRYRVVAFNATPETAASNETSATTSAASFVSAPTALRATTVSSTQINLSWTDNSNNESGFVVERATSGGAFTQVALLGSNATTYQNTGLAASTAYTYRVRAYQSGGTVSEYSNTDTAMTAGTGIGLTGAYYNDGTFSKLKTTRTDASVDFNWGNGTAVKGGTRDNFTARWTGQVQPTKDEAYTFYAKADDNVRLWINGELVLRRWGSANTSEYKTLPIQLKAGVKYNIQLDYREISGGASVALKWASPSVAKQVIPQSQLYTFSAGSEPPVQVDPYADSNPTIIGIDNGDGSSTTLAVPAGVTHTSWSGLFSSTPIRGGAQQTDPVTDADSEAESLLR